MQKSQSAVEKLFSLQHFGVKLGLENIKRFLEYIGNPQRHLKAFHVAGSNGKGSTSAFIASILMEAGYDVGLYSSPHFVRFNERIKINGEDITDHHITDFIQSYEEYIFDNKLTFFETTTALAFQYFHRNALDYVVIETGLGGRLDATNVMNPLACVLTSISLEHTNILGSELPKIAAEKAAIIKPGAKVFTGIIPPDAFDVIEAEAQKKGCELFPIEEFTNKRNSELEFYSADITIENIKPPLKGYFQKYNAALAMLTVYKTLDILDEELLMAGIDGVIQNTGIQARYETVSENPKMIVDSAHNPEGIVNFLAEFREEMDSYEQRILLFTCFKDKNQELMLRELKPFFDKVLLAQMDNERAASFSELLETCRRLEIDAKPVKDALEFVDFYLSKDSKHCLVALGSMYFIGDIKKYLETHKTKYNQ